jgi:hypothetical protein
MGAVPTAKVVGLVVNLVTHTDGLVRLSFSGVSLRCFPALSDFFAVKLTGCPVGQFVLPPALQLEAVTDKRVVHLFQLGCTTALAGYGALKQSLAPLLSSEECEAAALSLLPSARALRGELEAISLDARGFCKRYSDSPDHELRQLARKIFVLLHESS